MDDFHCHIYGNLGRHSEDQYIGRLCQCTRSSVHVLTDLVVVNIIGFLTFVGFTVGILPI